MFEEYGKNNLENGYSDWLKEKDENYKQAKNIGEVNEIIREKKKNLKSLIVTKEISDSINNSGSLLIDDNNYGSSMFSKLEFNDLKNAYTESVIPVIDEDYKLKKIYKNEGDFILERENNLKNIHKNLNHEEIYKKNKINENEINVRTAYNLAKQEENFKSIKKNMTRFLHQLT